MDVLTSWMQPEVTSAQHDMIDDDKYNESLVISKELFPHIYLFIYFVFVFGFQFKTTFSHVNIFVFVHLQINQKRIYTAVVKYDGIMSISSAKLLEPMEHPCKHCAQHHSVTTAPHHHHQQHHQQAHHSQPGIGTSVVLSTTTTTAHRYRPNEATPTGAFTIIASPALRQATDQCSSITKNHQTASTASDGVTSGATTVPQPQIIVVDDFVVDSNHQQMILAGHGSDAWTCRWLSSPSHRCSHASNAQSCCVSTVASDVHCYSSHNQITSISGDRLAKVTRSPSATQSPPPITCIHARSSRLVRAGGCYAEPEALVATRVPSTTASFANCPSFSASSQSPSSRQRQHTVAKQRPVTSATSVAVTFSNLILFCMVFIAFGMGGRNGTVYASDLARSSTNFSKLSTEEGSK